MFSFLPAGELICFWGPEVREDLASYNFEWREVMFFSKDFISLLGANMILASLGECSG
jgi:hypothetical protein